ncbi:uncharacterized protein LOC110814877 [Carica papaya]|uniref:uncharacterized protein LOC110814877 n=1 Tax=Carica papaya TaxID=3649 RepID=UPI000B8CFAA7|nr:uncharacterized protein LOC110814877 [Carica papaya]
MPRPGPRPYECVRRAWHSDRHQPMRGSLIQEIFRVVNEVHSSATKKNKEWQEKLPVVVLRAEEIMYSKANSEAEYMDLKTLWDRTNDAINTIIRRDESSETGDFLQPCIEAALNLGCTPRRASRSQRNVNPRCYLNLNNQEPTGTEISGLGNHTSNSHFVAYYLNFMKPSTLGASNLSSVCRNPVVQTHNCFTNNFPLATKNVSPSKANQCLSMESGSVSNLYTVYPLYYGNCFHVEESHHGSRVLPKPFSNCPEHLAKVGSFPTSCFPDASSSGKIIQTNTKAKIQEIPLDNECDLSLRLGPCSVPCPSVGNRQDLGDIDSNSEEGITGRSLTPLIDQEFCFFGKGNTSDKLHLISTECIVKDEHGHTNLDTTMRKRKIVLSQSMEDQQFCWQPKLPYNQFAGRMKSAGL